MSSEATPEAGERSRGFVPWTRPPLIARGPAAIPRMEAPEYLKEEWGLMCARATLTRLASVGGGPSFGSLAAASSTRLKPWTSGRPRSCHGQSAQPATRRKNKNAREEPRAPLRSSTADRVSGTTPENTWIGADRQALSRASSLRTRVACLPLPTIPRLQPRPPRRSSVACCRRATLKDG